MKGKSLKSAGNYDATSTVVSVHAEHVTHLPGITVVWFRFWAKRETAWISTVVSTPTAQTDIQVLEGLNFLH